MSSKQNRHAIRIEFLKKKHEKMLSWLHKEMLGEERTKNSDPQVPQVEEERAGESLDLNATEENGSIATRTRSKTNSPNQDV